MTENDEKHSSKFYCKHCDFQCGKQSNWSQHIITRKHKIKENGMTENAVHQSTFKCECGKQYKFRQGLWKHKVLCNQPVLNDPYSEFLDLKLLVLEVVKTNSELQKQIMEGCKGNNNTNVTNSIINSHNKTFNLQVFLNDTCKNAMNLADFVSSLQIDLTDLESVGELGFVNGISKLIINGLNDLEECERPVHCSDLKRESMYVKDDNKWEKEDSENTKMKKALKQIAHKNIKMLPVWKSKNPDYKRSDSHLSDKYSHMVIEAMGGSGDNDEEKANKIIRKIAKEVTISKNTVK
jgi:hypothetical protein